MKYEKEEIINLLDNNSTFVKRSLIALYERMEIEERAQNCSRYEDQKGFSKYDAKFMCSMSKKVMIGMELSVAEYNKVRYRLKKYTRQLIEIAEEKQKEKQKEKFHQIDFFEYIENINKAIKGVKKEDNKLYNSIVINLSDCHLEAPIIYLGTNNEEKSKIITSEEFAQNEKLKQIGKEIKMFCEQTIKKLSEV